MDGWEAAPKDAPAAVVHQVPLSSAAPSHRRALRALSSLRASARSHWLFVLLFTAGVALRTVVFLAYQPALFSPDSRFYLGQSARLEPPPSWPIGYPTFLRLLPLENDLAVVPFVQHLLGLAVAVLLYALLLRLGVPVWLGALATAPVLLDAYQLNIEQYILSEALFGLLLVAASALLLWQRPLGMASAGLTGLLFAAAALTRSIAVLAGALALLTVLFLGAGMPLPARLSRAVAFLAVFGVAVGGYVAWFHSIHGTHSLGGSAGTSLYGRVVPWVDCSEFSLPSYERALCPMQPVGHRPQAFTLLWSRIDSVEPPPGMTRSQIAGQFAKRAIRHQPGTYLRVVASDFATSFSPTKERRPGGYRMSQWQFQVAFPIPGYPPHWSTSPPAGFRHGDKHGHVRRSLASFLRTYQRFGYTPGPLLALGLLGGLSVAVGVGRARDSGLRSAAFLFSGLAIALCLGALAVVPFSWRYQLPQLILLPPAAAIAITALTRRGRESGSAEPDARGGIGSEPESSRAAALPSDVSAMSRESVRHVGPEGLKHPDGARHEPNACGVVAHREADGLLVGGQPLVLGRV
jgi:ABC-type multidrug transport system fused ATPase/permease subunit